MKKNQPERDQKIAFVQLMQYKLPLLYKYLFALEHGGSRHLLEAKNLKKVGVKEGLPDYFFIYPSNEYIGLFLEFKANNNTQTKKQKEFFELARGVGYKCVVVKLADEALNVVTEYIGDYKLFNCNNFNPFY